MKTFFKKNIGNVDKAIRIVIAIVASVLFVFNLIPGLLGFLALALSLVLFLTSYFGFCSIYAILGINSFKKKKADSKE